MPRTEEDLMSNRRRCSRERSGAAREGVAGESPLEPGEDLLVTLDELVPASFNRPYEAVLTASGGSGRLENAWCGLLATKVRSLRFQP